MIGAATESRSRSVARRTPFEAALRVTVLRDCVLC